MRRRCRKQSGFTLVEAVVVVAIIGIVVAISIPSLRRSRMRAAMLDTVRAFEQATAVARITAIKRGRNVCLTILADGSRQQLNNFHAWVDENENEIEDAGEEVLGPWQIRNADEWSFQESSAHQMYVLNSAGGGTARGIVYQPNGMASSEAAGQPGIGEGAFEYFIWRDSRKWNTFQISVFGGAGTVQVGMWDGSGWNSNFAYWEAY